MSKKGFYILLIGSIIFLFLINGIYYFYIKEQVILLYQESNTDPFFSSLIHKIYPRFEVEKHRFNLSFFLEKSQQVILRLSLLTSIIIVYLFFVKEKITFFEEVKDLKQQKYLRIFYYSFVLIVSYDWWESLILLENIRSFFKPISFLKVFQEMPPLWLNLVVYTIMVTSSILTIFNIKSKIFAWISIFCFCFIHGLFCSFEKMNHVFTTFIYVGLLFPFSFYAKTSWNIRLLQITICLTYFFAGMEKLLISHFAWISSTTFKAYLSLHQAPIGMWVAQYDWLCTLLPIGALFFQLSFFIQMFYPKLSKWYILGGFCFHWGTTLLFGISWFINPWLMPYIFFVDWKKVIIWIQNKQPKPR